MIKNIFCLWFSNTQSVYHSSVTMHPDNKFTRWLVYSPQLFTYQNSTDRNWSPILTSKWATTWNVIFHAEIWFRKLDMLWRTHAWLRGHLVLTKESSGQYQCDDVASAKQILPRNLTNSKHDFHLGGSWLIGVHFRWPCLSDFLWRVGGSSDLCRLCQFLWDSAEQTTLSRSMRLDSGRRFPLVYMCVLAHQNRKRDISGTQAIELVSLLHLWSISTHFRK